MAEVEEKKTLPFWALIIVVSVSVSVGYVTSQAVVKKIAGLKSTEDFLQENVEAINERLPMMVDHMTRWDSSAVLPGNQFVYNYTITEMPLEIDVEVFKPAMKQVLLENYQKSEDMTEFRERGITLVYSYSDADGRQFATVSISPEEL
ncbi:hypothetical protein [Thalassoroseus pseudoceratinae]|uniref:hypothetical protein n=1 Tax=Thalassoroseus pseudoceratinae TaxID=2713176 RepID=UPI001423249D|nr:hypothetical protein [Thalassoroseus pseudoceratinae]